MYIQQIYTNCLAQAAYYIESGKEAAIIDPLRNPEPYIAIAKERGATIKYVLETHFHADFVSGHIDLANKTGASIVFGPGATPGYKAYIAEDHELLHLGDAKIEILHTPGHTVESTCYLMHDEQGKESAVFTGDTLFVGDVGRPDLLSGNLSKEALAGMLFDSLQNKIKTLSADVVVYPGHGAGSACGKNISSKSTSTIGDECQTNYALLANDKQAFVSVVTSELPYIPGYFFKDAAINKSGYGSYDDIIRKNVNALSCREFAAVKNTGVQVLDTRDPMTFSKGFISGALNIGLNGDFAVWVGTLISADTQLLLVTEAGKELEAVERLARIGFEQIKGYLQGGIASWITANLETDTIQTVSAATCGNIIESGEYELLDVRNRREVAKQRVPGSIHIPLNNLKELYNTLDPHKKWLVYCAGGYRSMIAASFLKANGYRTTGSIEGGINDIIKHNPEIVELALETD